jgi:hypothetical protein
MTSNQLGPKLKRFRADESSQTGGILMKLAKRRDISHYLLEIEFPSAPQSFFSITPDFGKGTRATPPRS